MHAQRRRKLFFISPKFQGGVALAFGAVVFLGGALFAWLVYANVRQALWDASFTGHFRIGSAYEIVGGSVVKHLAGLFLGVLAASVALFFFLVSAIRKGTDRIASILRASGEGDLSTPTEAKGLKEFSTFGTQVDEMRAYTASLIEGIRAEVNLMRKGPFPPEEFRGRWEALKRKIGRIAP